VNGQTAKPNRAVREGDLLEIGRPYGRTQKLIVHKLQGAHIRKTEARQLYKDLTPPPTPEQVEERRLERLFRASTTSLHAPDKRQRRELRRLKGKL
jgi:ribosome-associated heat shock protein Hsp15